MKVQIIQIGCGGTGSWFARILGQELCQFNDVHKGLIQQVGWKFVDYDIIEKRNLLRQPFLAGIGVNKAVFLRNSMDELFDINGLPHEFIAKEHMARGGDLESTINSVLRDKNTDLNVIVSCVDNTYTRQILETTIAEYHMKNEDSEPRSYYVNMGVSPEGSWYVERICTPSLVPTKWDELTYPDAMLSCGQRAETTPVPQTTYSNVQAGTMAAHAVSMMLVEKVAGKEVPDLLCIGGKDFDVKDVTENYVPSHMKDLVRANNMEEKTTNGEDESGNEHIDLGELLAEAVTGEHNL